MTPSQHRGTMMTESRYVGATLIAFAIVFAVPAVPGAQLTSVKTETGTVSGSPVARGVVAYLGIPYAEPPVGDLRWRAPQPAKPWTGVRAADHFSNDCMQKPFPGDAAPRSQPLSEDCLG